VSNSVNYSDFPECDSVLGFDTLQLGMLPVDHCDTVITINKYD